jgi:hypothetical protein
MRTPSEKLTIMHTALNDINNEVTRAVKLHGPLSNLHEAHSVILEEFDEFWDQVKVNPKKLDLDGQIKRSANMKEELVQIAAMCVRTLMDVEI